MSETSEFADLVHLRRDRVSYQMALSEGYSRQISGKCPQLSDGASFSFWRLWCLTSWPRPWIQQQYSQRSLRKDENFIDAVNTLVARHIGGDVNQSVVMSQKNFDPVQMECIQI